VSGTSSREPSRIDPCSHTTTVSWEELAAEAGRRLRRAGVASPEVEARRLVEQASGLEAAELIAALPQAATHRGVAAFDRMLARRLAGEPLQYVLGAWGFRRLDLMVDRRVLIPRPETEIVAEHALAELDRRRATVADRPLLAADLGTGSGAIALSLAVESEGVEVWATDVSSDALAVARANLAGAGRSAARVRLVKGDWFEALPNHLRGRFDLVVSNPPYVAADERLPAEVERWEPAAALVAGSSGLEAFEVILASVRSWLAPGGAVVLELAPHQAQAVRRLATMAGLVDAGVLPDLVGRDRVLVARRPAA
jgi:release factor glutamine methyltransferase